MFPLRLITEFAHTKLSEVEKAMDWFFGDEFPPEDDEELWSQFTEWLVFDYIQTNGFTFLTEFVLTNPLKISEKVINTFRQIGETQFYSYFEIGEVKPNEWIMLEDLFGGKVYRVYDKQGSKGLENVAGSFYNRITRVDNRWYLVGANPQIIPVTHTKRMKKMFHNNSTRKEEINPKIVADFILNQRKKDLKPVKKLTKKDIKNKRKSLEKKYEEKTKKYGVDYPFEKLLEKIYRERGGNVINFWLRVAKDGLTEELVFKENKLLQDLWNYFPHKVLGDKSPRELSQEIYG